MLCYCSYLLHFIISLILEETNGRQERTSENHPYEDVELQEWAGENNYVDMPSGDVIGTDAGKIAYINLVGAGDIFMWLYIHELFVLACFYRKKYSY